MRGGLIGLCVATGLAVALGGCNTTGEHGAGKVGEAAKVTPYNDLPEMTSMAQAHHFGRKLVGYYAAGFDKANDRRRLFNLGVWAASTYTMGAAGLAAHSDNILVGALAGSSLGRLEPLMNEGGPEAWVTALGKTACLSRAATTGLDDETLQALEVLREHEARGVATKREQSALALHRGAYLGVGNGYDQVYAEFLTRRTGAPIPIATVAGFAATAEAEARNGRAALAPGETPAPTPSPEAAAQAARDAARADIETLADRIDPSGMLFKGLDSDRAFFTLSNGQTLTLDGALADPSRITDLSSGQTQFWANLGVTGPSPQQIDQLSALTQAIRGGALDIENARLRAQQARDAAAAEANARALAQQAARASEEAVVRIEAMNTVAARQIEFCLG